MIQFVYCKLGQINQELSESNFMTRITLFAKFLQNLRDIDVINNRLLNKNFVFFYKS